MGEGDAVGQIKSMPLVFKNAKGKGFPKLKGHLESKNELEEPTHGFALYQPDYHRSRLLATLEATDFSEEEAFGILNGSKENGAYDDLIVELEFDGVIQTRTIDGWKNKNNRKKGRLIIDTAWDPVPNTPLSLKIYAAAKAADTDSITLDPYALQLDDAYKNAHILVWYQNERGNTIYQYKKITEYDGGSCKATVDTPWSEVPPVGSQFVIGAPPHTEATEFNKKFAYWAPDDPPASNNPQDFPDGQAPYTFAQVARYHPFFVKGKVQSGGVIGMNELFLDEDADPTNGIYDNRYITITRNGSIIQYKLITNYDGASRKITVQSNWEVALIGGGPNADEYQIGAAQRPNDPNDEARKYTYLAPDDPINTPNPKNFADGSPPYKYQTYKMLWE